MSSKKIGRCSGSKLFGCEAIAYKHNFVCDICNHKSIALSRCRFSLHFTFEGEDGHFICKRPRKIQVSKFSFVYGRFHLIVFGNTDDACSGSKIVNSRQSHPRYGMFRPSEILPPDVWVNGITLSLKKQLHRLVPFSISQSDDSYVHPNLPFDSSPSIPVRHRAAASMTCPRCNYNCSLGNTTSATVVGLGNTASSSAMGVGNTANATVVGLGNTPSSSAMGLGNSMTLAYSALSDLRSGHFRNPNHVFNPQQKQMKAPRSGNSQPMQDISNRDHAARTGGSSHGSMGRRRKNSDVFDFGIRAPGEVKIPASYGNRGPAVMSTVKNDPDPSHLPQPTPKRPCRIHPRPIRPTRLMMPGSPRGQTNSNDSRLRAPAPSWLNFNSVQNFNLFAAPPSIT
eukprot:7455_1